MTRANPEEQIQRAMVEWLNLCVPPPPDGPYWTAVNPVPAKSVAVAGVSKALGLKAGTPDFVFCINGRFVGIEVKPPKKYLSPAQKDAHTAITLSKGLVFVARSVDELEGFLRGLGVSMRAVGAAAL
ncbi:MAG: VRR-NUC domain-containing protein [Geminicoccaceae bacterium]